MTTSSQGLVADYVETLKDKAPGTVLGYQRALDAFADWLSKHPGSHNDFQPDTLVNLHN